MKDECKTNPKCFLKNAKNCKQKVQITDKLWYCQKEHELARRFNGI